MYTPIYIQPEVEAAASEPRNWVQATLRSIQRYFPLLLYYALPHGRTSVEVQLRTRATFPKQDWPINQVDFAVQVARTVQRSLNLPNAHFLPNDPLLLLLIGDYDDMPYETVRHELNREFSLEITRDEVRSIYSDGDWTFQGLVEFVHGKQRDSSRETKGRR